MPFSVEITVIAIAVIYVGLSVACQLKLVNRQRMREIRIEMAKIQGEMKQMMKNKASQEAIMAKNKEIMPLAGEQMKSSLATFIILPVFLFFYWYLIPTVFGSAYITAFAFLQNLTPTMVFFYTAFVLGFIASIAILLYDSKKMKQMKLAKAAEAEVGLG